MIDLHRKELEFAVRLLSYGRNMFGRAIEDVFAWRVKHTTVFAFRGSPWDIVNRVLGSFPIRERRPHGIEMLAARILGVEQRIEHGHPSPQFTSSGEELSQAEFFEMLEGIGASFIEMDGSQVCSVTILPYPGVPMTRDGQTLSYFSAAEKKWIVAGSKPRWVIARDPSKLTPEEKRETTQSVDWCKLARTATMPADFHQRFGYAYADGFALIAAHSVGEALFEEEANKGISRCGGLIFPSLSVGAVPASNFGMISIVFDPRTVLNSLSPFRLKRGTPPDFVVYETDTWTPNTREILGSYSRRTFLELSGNEEFSSYYRQPGALLSLGPWSFASNQRSAPLRSVEEVIREAKKRARAWPRGMTLHELEQKKAEFIGKKEQYGYLEAKALGVVPIAWASAVAAPRRLLSRTVRYLERFGFSGDAIEVPVSKADQGLLVSYSVDNSARADIARMEYAWRVSDAILSQTTGIDISR